MLIAKSFIFELVSSDLLLLPDKRKCHIRRLILVLNISPFRSLNNLLIMGLLVLAVFLHQLVILRLSSPDL